MIFDKIFGKPIMSNKATITINGKTYSGHNIEVKNGNVKVDGNLVDKSQEDLKLIISGSVANIRTDRSVEITGNVEGDVDAGGSVRCGNVGNDVDAGGSVNCGDINGDADAGGSITCRAIHGDADAGGSIIGR